MTTRACTTADIAMIMNSVFHPIREARSSEYKAGCEATLRSRLMGVKPQCPFDSGTCQADAWYAGGREGHQHARDWLEGQYEVVRGRKLNACLAVVCASIDEVKL